MSSLQEKAAIVTGSSRGIGRGIAERLGHDGASVVVTYVGNRDKAEEVVQAITSAESKAVIKHFSTALAKELGARGITVNTISPGVTETDGLVLEQINQMVAQTPLGR